MLKGILLLIAVVILFAAGFRKMEDVDFFQVCRYAEQKRTQNTKQEKSSG